MTRRQYQTVCNEVTVLSELVAQSIRSFTAGSAATRLERDALNIATRFAVLAKASITTPADEARIRRRLRAARRRPTS